ncbi:hypothetical protein Dsin_016629 [Dipteronia sinensis]|uniref:GRAM domain-containing protein n=1 Tax=Dipteronia sinensis TaxID=43782 RepID=A0AAE0AE82_9ROSI|nr:hypothetical protein Dsin_016629 [Dipteronia sinensis]
MNSDGTTARVLLFSAEAVSSSSSSHASDTKKNINFPYRIRQHVSLGPKFSEIVKGKLSLGAKIIQQGGRENIFKKMFDVSEGEKLLKASQCYCLSSTQVPIAGLLFISTQNVAFCSERSIILPSSTGQITTPDKVIIPIKKIKSAKETEDVNKPEDKYIKIITVEDLELRFMGFLRFEKAFHNLQKAISTFPKQV